MKHSLFFNILTLHSPESLWELYTFIILSSVLLVVVTRVKRNGLTVFLKNLGTVCSTVWAVGICACLFMFASDALSGEDNKPNGDDVFSSLYED